MEETPKKKKKIIFVTNPSINQMRKEELCLKRLEETYEKLGIRKSDIAESLSWPISRVSKILSRQQKASMDDLEKMALLTGYPLDAFIGNKFDLSNYDIEKDATPIVECIDAYCTAQTSKERKNIINEKLAYTIKKKLDLDTNAYLIHTEMHELSDVFYSEEAGGTVSYIPEITIRPKGAEFAHSVIPEMGYWIDREKRYLILAISCAQVEKLPMGRPSPVRDYYKALLDLSDSENEFDKILRKKVYLPETLKRGEVTSIIYSLEDGLPDEPVMVADLMGTYKRFQKLQAESVKRMSDMYWSVLERVGSKAMADVEQEETNSEVLIEEALKVNKKRLRSTKVIRAALEEKNYVCELDSSHITFMGKDGKPYMQAHYLVPLAYANDFQVSLDVAENVICLCPNCHALLSYADKDIREQRIVQLYYSRKEKLKTVGIEVSLSRLLEMYDVK